MSSANGHSKYKRHIKQSDGTYKLISQWTSSDTVHIDGGDVTLDDKISDIQSQIDDKVDKVEGKGLSTNDYTTTEKNKLAGIASGAEVNQNAFGKVVVGDVTVAADAEVDSLTIAAGTGISVAGDATNDKVTITNSGVRSISTGTSNGTISVNTNGTSANVAVKGLGSAAYTASTAYDAAGTAQTKADAALASAKSYADGIKNDLLNGAGTAYDTLSELGALIDDNHDAIEALETVAAGKQATITGAATTVTSSNLTASRALVSNSSGKIAVSAVTSTELGYLDGVTSAIQTQLDGKAASGHTHSAATTSADGLMSAADKTKLDGIASGANKYTHPSYTSKSNGLYKVTVDSTGHVSGTTAVAKSDITALGIPAQDTTYSTFVKSGSSAKEGLVPAPSTTAGTTKYLREDGTWATPPDTNTTYSSLKNPYSLTIQGNGTTLTNGTYDGSAAKTVNITPASIGAAASSHTHSDYAASSHTHSSYANQNAFSNVKVGDTTVAADTTTDTLTLAGSNVTITPDATNDKVTIGITKDNVTAALGYTPPTTNTTYSAMTGATSSAAGKAGLVPAPAAGKQTSFLRGDGTWVVPTNTTYSAATTSANGLMTSAMVTKLNGIAEGANAYTLPTASSSTLGGVKTTSTVTSTSGLTACPIISGVPYYKDTNTTYTLDSITGTLALSKGGTGATDAATARTNLGLGSAATKSSTTSITSGGSGLITSGAVYTGLSNKLNTSAVVTSLDSTSTTNALAASAGKNLQDQITQLNSELKSFAYSNKKVSYGTLGFEIYQDILYIYGSKYFTLATGWNTIIEKIPLSVEVSTVSGGNNTVSFIVINDGSTSSANQFLQARITSAGKIEVYSWSALSNVPLCFNNSFSLVTNN